MTSTQSETGASALAGFAAAMFCTIAWLGGGMALLAIHGGVA